MAKLVQCIGHLNYELIRHAATEQIKLVVNHIFYLAYLVFPVHYQFKPTKTAKTSCLDTFNMLGLRYLVGARLLLVCNSLVCGDP